MTLIEYLPHKTARDVYQEIILMLDSGYSYAAIGKILLPELMPPSRQKSTIYHWYVNDKEPQDNEIRMMLNIPILRKMEYIPGQVSAPACPTCGEAPTVCLCDGCQVVNPEEYTIKRKATTKRKRAPRIAVSKVDPASAAKSLSNNLAPKVLAETVRILLQDGMEMEF